PLHSEHLAARRRSQSIGQTSRVGSENDVFADETCRVTHRSWRRKLRRPWRVERNQASELPELVIRSSHAEDLHHFRAAKCAVLRECRSQALNLVTLAIDELLRLPPQPLKVSQVRIIAHASAASR